MKPLLIGGLLAISGAAFADAPRAPVADAPKVQRMPHKLDREARVYVMDKDVPSADKTVALGRLRPSLKDK